MHKICYIIQDLSYGGIPTFLINLTTKLKGMFEFYFIATDNPNISAKFHNLGNANYFGHDWAKITKFFKDKNIGIVQFGNCLPYKECAIKAKVPIIIERTAGPRSCSLNREGVTHVISSTKGTIPLIRKNYDGPISIIYNGVNVDKYDNVKSDRLHFKNDDFVICYCARIGGVGQGFQDLIPAVIKVHKTHNDKLVLIGERPKSSVENIIPRLKKMAKPIGVDCVFTGSLADPVSVMAGADLYVCPAHHHGISNSIIEACALGKPVVATNVGQTNEIVHDGKNGYLITPKNISFIIKSIIKIIDSPKNMAEFGAYGKDLIKREFNIDMQADKYLKLYRKLLESIHK